MDLGLCIVHKTSCSGHEGKTLPKEVRVKRTGNINIYHCMLFEVPRTVTTTVTVWCSVATYNMG